MKKLLALIAAVPAGERLPIGRFARLLNSTQSVVMGEIEKLVARGKIDPATMRPASVAEPPAPAASLAHGCSGAELVRALRRGAAEAGVSICRFVGPLTGYPSQYLADLERAHEPRPHTVDRVRALLLGEPLPPGQGRGRCDSTPQGEVRVTGELLMAEILAAAKEAGVTPQKLVEPITAAPHRFINQVRLARFPRRDTIDKVRALIGGKPVERPPVRPAYPTMRRADREALGIPPSRREIDETRNLDRIRAYREREEQKKRAAERAQSSRRPGETLAEAVKREAAAKGARRAEARMLSGITHPLPIQKPLSVAERIRRLGAEVDEDDAAELAAEAEARREREIDEMVSPSAVLRRAQRDWPDQCDKVKAIAAELGVQLGEAWRRVIGAGVLCLSEDLREEADEHGFGEAVQRSAQ